MAVLFIVIGIGLYKGQECIACLIIGIGLSIFVIVILFVKLKRSLHILWVFKNVKAYQLWLTIEARRSSDSFNYYARLSKDETNTILSSIEGGNIIGPLRTIKVLEKKQVPVKVYVDPKTSKPAVIETEVGLLWLW